MTKSRFFIVCTLALAIIGFAIGAHKSTNVHSSSGSPSQSASHGHVAQLPEHVPYLILVRHLSYLKKQGDQLRTQGRDDSGFRRRFVKQFALDEDQFEKISEIATDTESKVAEIDKRADAVIDDFRKRFPEGRLPAGVVPPPPPAELLALQREHDETILRARDRMRAELGEREFNRFDEVLKIRVSGDLNQADQR